MNTRITMVLLFVFSLTLQVLAQKNITEAVLTYNINLHAPDNKPMTNMFTGSSFTVYLKGGLSRTEMVNSLGTETTILDSKTGNAVILKEYSGQKLMITFNKEEWVLKNKKSEQITFIYENESKTINGYNCTKASAKLADGNELTVFYTKDLQTANTNYNPLFKNLAGMPLWYEYKTPKLRFVYEISKIDFGSVTANRFEFPKSGYRVLTYTENQQAVN